MFLLGLFDLVFDTVVFGESLIESLTWDDVVFNLILSCLFALLTWRFKDGQFQSKSEIIEMNLTKENGETKK